MTGSASPTAAPSASAHSSSGPQPCFQKPSGCLELEGLALATALRATQHPLTGETVPITLGHEFAGVVHEVGNGVDDVHVGDPVAVEPYIICGHCDACAQGKHNVCQSKHDA